LIPRPDRSPIATWTALPVALFYLWSLGTLCLSPRNDAIAFKSFSLLAFNGT
jgi:hypothetical protein